MNRCKKRAIEQDVGGGAGGGGEPWRQPETAEGITSILHLRGVGRYSDPSAPKRGQKYDDVSDELWVFGTRYMEAGPLVPDPVSFLFPVHAV